MSLPPAPLPADEPQQWILVWRPYLDELLAMLEAIDHDGLLGGLPADVKSLVERLRGQVTGGPVTVHPTETKEGGDGG